jgi:hypothetical protein
MRRQCGAIAAYSRRSPKFALLHVAKRQIFRSVSLSLTSGRISASGDFETPLLVLTRRFLDAKAAADFRPQTSLNRRA